MEKIEFTASPSQDALYVYPKSQEMVMVMDTEWQRGFLLVEFAKAALAGLLANAEWDKTADELVRLNLEESSWDATAAQAWLLAEAMLTHSPQGKPSSEGSSTE